MVKYFFFPIIVKKGFQQVDLLIILNKNQVYAYGGSMIFPEIVRILYISDRRFLYLFIFEDGGNAPTYGLLERIGEFLSSFSFKHFKQLILYVVTKLDHCANRDLRCLPYVWSICIRMDIGFPTSLFFFLLTIHLYIYIPVLPRAIYSTTRIPRS